MPITENSKVRLKAYPEKGKGQVLRVCEENGEYKADVVFEKDNQRLLETFSVDALEEIDDILKSLEKGNFCQPVDFFLRQLAFQFPLENAGGELTNSKTDLLPHQILLTHNIVKKRRRKFLIADEVGLGKTIETGMIIRELNTLSEGNRILVICPAGLTENWQNELRSCFRMHFDILGKDFSDSAPYAWEKHPLAIVSIDTIKKTERLEKLASGPRWDLVVIDEAHHLSRKKYGNKVERTQNYKMAEKIRNFCRDMLLLTATPHQGDAYQFWSLIQLLDDQLFETPEALKDHRGLLGRVLYRRTKREVTDSEGRPIFMRRQVHSQHFRLSLREERYYEKITEYLKAGYTVAGVANGKTTSLQRAVGFLMATFQKIMSSSPRAIKQALRRRLLAVYARKQMVLESGKEGRVTDAPVASKIMKYQEKMQQLVKAIFSYEKSCLEIQELDAYISNLKLKISKRPKFQEEMTSWALDASESEESSLEVNVNIPEEEEKLIELIDMIDEGPDRKFDTLIRAIEQLRKENPKEKIIIFTQYLETLRFLQKELGHYYQKDKIAVVRGGPIEDKIAACEDFWKEEGADFLLSTTAGGEGINLQVCRILFNYDLPWNPMAVEQRIGRIHRYGQNETAQIYNLIGEGTIEERVYSLLENKLKEIAQTIGKVDDVTGEVTEDFRAEVLGCLAGNTNYSELYKNALVFRDYQRTEREIEQGMLQAKEASSALHELTQNLETFNLENYTKIKGKYTLSDLRLFVEKAVLRLGGGFIPSGEIVEILVPEALKKYSNVSAVYKNSTFNRKMAVRKKGVELLGIGHPLINALLDYFKSDLGAKEITYIQLKNNQNILSFRYLFKIKFQDNTFRTIYEDIVIGEQVDKFSDIQFLSTSLSVNNGSKFTLIPYKDKLQNLIKTKEAMLRSQYDGIVDLRKECIGILAIN
ncbi:MAG: DEAD/DEAH box helicase [Candidatus Aureabacteria bacterium]|nr:DEAD/DEAH box helicase [Candidatus Auribacterota bacterium]